MSNSPDRFLTRTGIPSMADYRAVVESLAFNEMENFSNDFLSRNAFVKDAYTWVRDPLHQWSRQYEYPYVYQQVAQYIDNAKEQSLSVLDAGSGVTFFPYWIKSRHPNVAISCCDYDESLSPLFDELNAMEPGAVSFQQADMRQLPYENDSFDVIYCVSVLEHTTEYPRISDEIRRILKPGGIFIATFDIGIDGISEISLLEAEKLHDYLARIMAAKVEPRDLPALRSTSLTSRQLGSLDARLLPWRYPILSWLKTIWKRKRLPTSFGKNLTVLCASYTKPNDATNND